MQLKLIPRSQIGDLKSINKEGGPSIDIGPKAVDNGHSPLLAPTLFPAVHTWLFVCVRVSAVDDAWRCPALSCPSRGRTHSRIRALDRIPACHSDILPSLPALRRAIGNVRSSDGRIRTTTSLVRRVPRCLSSSGCRNRMEEWATPQCAARPLGWSLPRAPRAR